MLRLIAGLPVRSSRTYACLPVLPPIHSLFSQLSQHLFESNRDLCGYLTALANGRVKGPGMEQCSAKCKDIIRGWYKLFQTLPVIHDAPSETVLPPLFPAIPRKSICRSPPRVPPAAIGTAPPNLGGTEASAHMLGTDAEHALQSCIRACLKSALPNAAHRVPARVLRRVARGFARVYPSIAASPPGATMCLSSTQKALVHELVKDQLTKLNLWELLESPAA
jgi:hypothetical protein